jgi:hypothetical protein
MRFEAVVYFASPRTIFSGKMHEEDVILRKSVRWKWLARLIAGCIHAMLHPERAGCVVVDSFGKVIEHTEPERPDPAKFKRGKTTLLGQ